MNSLASTLWQGVLDMYNDYANNYADANSNDDNGTFLHYLTWTLAKSDKVFSNQNGMKWAKAIKIIGPRVCADLPSVIILH